MSVKYIGNYTYLPNFKNSSSAQFKSLISVLFGLNWVRSPCIGNAKLMVTLSQRSAVTIWARLGKAQLCLGMYICTQKPNHRSCCTLTSWS